MLKVLDAFAGAGGFSLGFSMAGCEVVGAIEMDKWACETFRFNHPETPVFNRDIQSLSDEEIARIFRDCRPEVLLGGPPCQGYSICRKSAGDPTDPRNTLFVDFLRFARVLQPAFVVMENVPNIANARTHLKEPVIEIIKRELRLLGYHVYHSVLEATDFGVPQIRKRLFVLASERPLDDPFPAATHALAGCEHASLFGAQLTECPTLWEAISDLPKLAAGKGEHEQAYVGVPLNNYQRQMRKGATRLFNHIAMNHTPRMVERFQSMACGDSVSDVPAHLRPLRRNGNGAVSATAYDQNNRRMYPHKPCHTIPASFYANFVHPYQHRNFTPREGARLQSFPDWFVFKGKPTVVSHKLLAREGRTEEKHLCQYNQIGNAVPPLMAKAIAKHLVKQMKETTYAGAR